MSKPKPLQFGITQSLNHHDYSDVGGESLWVIGLPDGREATVWADRVEITTVGALIAWQDTNVTERDSDRNVEAREPQQPFANVMLSPGAWVHCYVVNAFTGAPVAISTVDAPKSKAVYSLVDSGL